MIKRAYLTNTFLFHFIRQMKEQNIIVKQEEELEKYHDSFKV